MHFSWILVQKATYGEVCTICDDTLKLSCDAGNYCTCNSSGNYFWNGTFCGKSKISKLEY